MMKNGRHGIFSFFTGAGFLDLGFEDARVFVFNAEAQRRREGMAA